MSNESRAEAVGTDTLLAALEGPYEEAVDAATDEELDEELARLGFDPEEITRSAGTFRRRLHERYLVDAETDAESACPTGPNEAPGRWPRSPYPEGVEADRAEAVEVSGSAAPARRRVLVAADRGRVAEASSIRGNVHRLLATTGLAGRLGLRFEVIYVEDLGQRAIEAWLRTAQHPLDLVIACISADASSEVSSWLSHWPLGDVRDQRPENSQQLGDGAARGPRVVELVAVDRCLVGKSRGGPPERVPHPAWFDVGPPDIEVRCYEDAREFEQTCERVLARWLLHVRLELLYGRVDVPHPPAAARTTLCLSLAGGSALGGDPVEMSEGSVHLWNRIGALIGACEGTLSGRFLDVAFFDFFGADRHCRAIEAALRLIGETARSRHGDPASGRVAFLRLAVHDLPEHPKEGRALPEGFGFMLALAERPEVSTGFAATASVVDGLEEETKATFRSGGRFCGVPYAVCEAPPVTSRIAASTLSARDLDDVSRFRVELEAAASATGAPKNRLLDAVDTAVGRFYTAVEACCRRVETERGETGRARAGTLDLVRRILSEESRTWELVERVSSRSMSEGGDGSWRAPLYIAAARRASVVFELERASGLAAAAETEGVGAWRMAGAGREPEAAEPPAGNMLKAIRRVLRGDELDAYTGFIELATYFKAPVVRYLREVRKAAEVGCMEQWLQGRLWQVAELLVAEDASELESSGCLLVPAVLSSPLADVRFRALCRFLDEDRRARGWKPADELRARGAVVSPGHEQKLWQGRLLTARDPDRRHEAAEQLHWNALWPLLTYPRTPLASIAAIAARFASVRFERYGQVCLDCVAPRLQRCLDPEYVDDGTLAGVRACINVFSRFQFAASAGSFERLGVVSDLYRQRRATRGLAVDSPLDPLLARAPEDLASPEERKELLFGLPLVVQRHLASEGLYLDFFACHPDYRIARETLRHVRADRVERFASLRGINGALFHDLLRAPGLFNRPGALETALRHPKCDPGFATRNLSRLGRAGLLRLIRDPGVNAEIRSRAESHLNVRGFPRASPAPGPTWARDGR
jgi:hypothetical protein